MESRERNGVATQDDFRTLADEVVEVCESRNWSLHWTERGAYLHLESSELIEAVRGKRGEIAKEAGDVLFVLLSILQPNKVTVADAVAALRSKIAELKIKSRYAGEQHHGREENAVKLLLPYVDHLRGCASYTNGACTCGFENAMQDLTAETTARAVAALSSRDKEIREVLEGLRNAINDCWCPTEHQEDKHSPACLAAMVLWEKVQG